MSSGLGLTLERISNMKPFECPEYLTDIDRIIALPLPWEKLSGRTMLISGASGLMGSCLVDVIMRRNALYGLNCRILALGKNAQRAGSRLGHYWGNPLFLFVQQDVNTPFSIDEKADFVVHLASNTHPVAYATDPVSTIMTNVVGLKNMLDYAVGCSKDCRFAFASSNEIYGQNRGDVEFFDEEYCGYIDSNTLRAGYPESKRCGEALCQAYAKQYGLDILVPRFTRSFGPTLLPTDTKALSQFLHNAVNGEDIVLKSDGSQYYSYTYVCDAVSGLLYILLYGNSGEAYNIADASLDITLRSLAETIADICGVKVVFDIPDAVEAAGFSRVTKARLSCSKLRSLGWRPLWNIQEGLSHTISALKQGF